jgi:hypothetical protein
VRWPFANWLRGAPGGHEPSPGGSGAALASAEPHSALGAQAVLPADDWRDLPALRGTIGAAPITAKAEDFARGLAGRRTPEPTLAPLGHDVIAGGPAGLVSGIAMPLVQRATSKADERAAPALPAPAAPGHGRSPVRRLVTSAATLPRGDSGEGTPDGREVPEAAAPAGPSPVPIPGPGAGEPAPAISIVSPRTLPVAPLATSPSAVSATRVADATAPAPVLALARAVEPGTPSDGSSPPAPPAAPSSPATGSETPTEEGDPFAAGGSDGSRQPLVARRTLGESRRLGLGAPLTRRPPSPAAGSGRADLPVARLSRSTDAPPGASTPPLTAPPMPAAAAAAAASLPRLAVARRTPPEPESAATSTAEGGLAHASSTAEGATDAGAAGPRVDDPATGLGRPGTQGQEIGSTAGLTRPLVGATLLGVSRLVADDEPVDADAAGAAEPGGTALPLAGLSSRADDWSRLAAIAEPSPSSADGAPAGAGGSPADPIGPTGTAAIEREHLRVADTKPAETAGAALAASSPRPTAPLAPGRAMRASRAGDVSTLALATGREPAPVVARLAVASQGAAIGTDGRPARTSDAAGWVGPSAGAAGSGREERPIVSRAVQAPGSDRSTATPGLPLARPATGSAMPDESGSAEPGDRYGWRAGDGFPPVGASSRAFVQRAVTIDELTVTPASAGDGPAAGAQPAPAGQPVGSSGVGAGADSEELAEQVYDRIRARLTADLLLDRERAGMLVDG